MQFLSLLTRVWGWLGPFVKEMFYGKYQFANYLAERKLVTVLLVATILQTLLLAYMVEQAIAFTKEVIARNERIEELTLKVESFKGVHEKAVVAAETVPVPMDTIPEPPEVEFVEPEPEPEITPQPLVHRPKVHKRAPREQSIVTPPAKVPPTPTRQKEDPAVRSNLRTRMSDLTIEDF